jgi:apolipoprotein N-acyltransferase
MATLGFAPFGWWPLGVISLAGLWALTRNAASTRQVAGAALVWGLGHTLTALYWLPWAFFRDADGSWLAAIGGGVPAMVGLAIYSALGPVVACVAGYRARRVHVLLGGPVWVGVWVGLEFIKGLSPFGFPWLPVGAMWATWPTLAQGASIGGVWLLSGLILTLALLLSWPVRKRVTAAVVVLLGLTAAGAWRLATTPVPEVLAPRIRLVQPNIQSQHKWDPTLRWQFLEETLNTAFSGTGQGILSPATVVLPETAVAFFLSQDPETLQRLAGQIPPHTGVVTGTVRMETDPNGEKRYFNSLTVLTDSGRLGEMYDKQLLVPFGEFIPFHSTLEKLPLPGTLRTLSQSRLDFTPGLHSPRLQTPAGLAVGLICYEGIFPYHVLKHSQGARYLVNVTNDNWFTGTIALAQHAALARLRAIETGLPLVRVANTGLTEVIDSYGRVVVQLPPGTASRSDISLPPVAPRTWLSQIFF